MLENLALVGSQNLTGEQGRCPRTWFLGGGEMKAFHLGETGGEGLLGRGTGFLPAPRGNLPDLVSLPTGNVAGLGGRM